MTTWSDFAEGLAETLATLPSGAVVIIAEPGPLRTARGLPSSAGTARGFMPKSPEASNWLNRALTGLASSQTPVGGAPDLTVTRTGGPLPWPATSGDYRPLASMIVTALRDALGIAKPDDLEYHALNENYGNAPIELPLLGIPCNAGS